MEELLRDLPEIFERKFQQRLQPLLERQDRLLEDNQHLRQQMRQLTATNVEMRQLPPAAPAATPAPAAPAEALQLPTLPDKPPKRWSFLGNRSDSNRAA
jgi:predicted component of type VI protein secretion system